MRIARDTGFNFARVFLNFHVWDAQRDTFLANLRHFVSTAYVPMHGRQDPGDERYLYDNSDSWPSTFA